MKCYSVGMASSPRRWAFFVLASAGVLFACNQILGVEDVKLKANGTRLNNEGGTVPGDDDDTSPPPGTLEDGEAPPPEDPARPSLALGFSHSCARMLDGTVRCWGDNYGGLLGDGSDAGSGEAPDKLRPANVVNMNDAVAIAAGTTHTCAVRKTGKVSCWGSGLSGTLGTGKNESSSSPVDVLGVEDAVAVGAGGPVTCIVHRDGTASCWGSNSAGGLGDGTTADSNKPVKVNDLKDIVQIAPSTNHTCAVLKNGDLYCWGGASDGQLGTGSLTPTTKPTKLTALADVAQVTVASRYSCARMKSGSVACWGRNESGQLGNGSPTDAPNPSPIAVPFLTDAIFIWAGYGHTCAVRKTGIVSCWGDGSYGQLGIGPVDAGGQAASTPQEAKVLKTAKAVWTGGFRTCAVTADDKAFCWGSNDDGELGIGSNDPKDVPTAVSDFN